ncbi:MAG: acylneuraminate cytidylyltransferase family protein [Pseudolabrys sp.]|nr:acylneuraminate cytidylyltransferase family protein [Pseudolabrys sp.]
MIHGRTVLAVVPARGGSKGIPLKNLREVGGRSLIARVGDIVGGVPEVDRAIVSTDHALIKSAAESVGLAAPYMRPESISGDRIGDFDVLLHALESTEALDGNKYDIVVMLQPTSPLRTSEQVSATIRMLVDGSWDSVWTVSETDTKAHPLKQLTVVDGVLNYYDTRGADIIARQQLQPVFHRNGIAYAITRECLVKQRSIKGHRAGALVIQGPHLSIDTEEDIALVEWFLSRSSGSDR